MKRIFTALLLALYTACAIAQVPIYTRSTGINQGAVNITGGTITGVSGVPVKLAQWAVPVGMAPSGTMANNGAVTFGTAFLATYSNGIWLYYPAGAVAAGVPAAATYLWTVMSSTTVGQVFNSSFDGLSVPVAGTTTAFSTTGPGAFTGVSTITTAVTMTIPANTLGATGAILGDWRVDQNGAAGNKTFDIFYTTTGGTNYGNIVFSTQNAGGSCRTTIQNQTTGAQNGASACNPSSSALGSGTKYSSADTTASTTLVMRMTNSAPATSWMVITGGSFFTEQ